MPRKIKPVLREWSDLSTREQSPRENYGRGIGTVQEIQIIDPRAMARAVADLGPDAEPWRVANAGFGAVVAQVWIQYPRDGAGTLRVLARTEERPGEGQRYFVGSAGGGGYDKLAACLSGFPIPALGLVLGDHPNGPTLDRLRETHGVLVLGL